MTAFLQSGLIILLWCLVPKEYHLIWPLVIFFVAGFFLVRRLVPLSNEKRHSPVICRRWIMMQIRRLRQD